MRLFDRPLVVALLLLMTLVGCAANRPASPPPPSDAIEAGLRAFMADEGFSAERAASLGVTVEAEAGPWVRVRVSDPTPNAQDAFWAFLQREGEQWVVASYGTAFDPETLEAEGIPLELLPAIDPEAFAPTLCQSLQGTLDERFGVPFVLAEVPFTDPLTGDTSEACRVAFEGSGEALGGATFPTIQQGMVALFRTQGWQEDAAYVADGPAAWSSLFRQAGNLCQVEVGWQPTSEAGEGPAAYDAATPAQQQWIIAATCVEA